MHSSKCSSCVFKYILYKLWKSLKFVKKENENGVPSIKIVPLLVWMERYLNVGFFKRRDVGETLSHTHTHHKESFIQSAGKLVFDA